MHKTGLVILVSLFIGLVGSAQHLYTLYYDRSTGGDLEINFLNISPNRTTFQLRVYNAWGSLLRQESAELDPYDSAFARLSEFIPEKDANWGLILVESSELLALGLEYTSAGELVTVETITQELPLPSLDVHYRLFGYYNQAGDASTGVVLMNPWDIAVSCLVKIYDEGGNLIYEDTVTIGAYEAEFGALKDIIGSTPRYWGLVVVESVGMPVVAAIEHYGRSQIGLEIDNLAPIPELPLLPISPPSQTPSETVPSKL